KEQDAALTKYATIAIVEGVNRRIELVVASDRGQPHHIRVILVGILLKAGKDEEIRLAGRCIPGAVARRGLKVEAARLSNTLIEVLEDREYRFDRVANAVVVRDHFLPIDPRFGQGCLRHAGDDRRLGEEVRTCRPVATGRCPHHAGRILDGDHLRPLAASCLLSSRSSASMSRGVTKSASLSSTRCKRPMWPIERSVLPPILRTRSAMASVVAKICSPCSSRRR